MSTPLQDLARLYQTPSHLVEMARNLAAIPDHRHRLSIHRGLSTWVLQVTNPDFMYGRCVRQEAVVPFGTLSTRPDPSRRAWDALEAQKGMSPRSEP